MHLIETPDNQSFEKRLGDICGVVGRFGPARVRAPRRRTGGVTLTELLAATLVMSGGALGLAGLQAESLHAGREAYQRSVAVQRAVGMMDRIRANGALATSEFVTGRGAPESQDCTAAACGLREMARFEVAGWKCALGAWPDAAACVRMRDMDALADVRMMPGLPEGDGSVDVDAGTGVVTVTVSWRPPGRASPLAVALSSRM